jgi:hypothetical protein
LGIWQCNGTFFANVANISHKHQALVIGKGFAHGININKV